MTSDLEKLTADVVTAVYSAGAFIRKEFGQVNADQVESKAMNSLVSYVDKQAEIMLVEALSEIIPHSGFVTEEDTIDDDQKKYVWIIDPLDGTTNFLYNIPHFSVSVALQIDGVLSIGVVYNVIGDEMYQAYSGGGAKMNNHPIQVSPSTDFAQCVIATGFPYDSSYDKQPYFKMMDIIMSKARGLRRFGSAALDLAYVANGRFNAFYETSLNPWDVAGGIVICREAGAEIGDYFGTHTFKRGTSIIAANPEITKTIQNYTRQFFDAKKIAAQ